jgi:hypothetical protein
VADELPTLASLPNIEENAKQLNEAQQQQEAIVEERREAAEIERLGRFRDSPRHRPGAHADRNVIATVQDGLIQHTFREVDNANVDFTRTGQPFDKTTGRPLLTKAEAETKIKVMRGRRLKPQP